MIALLILDGWGYNPNAAHNAIANALLPQWTSWWNNQSGNVLKSLLHCGSTDVGLPLGQVGNSEVGHMHMGAGRIIYQDFTRINKAIEDKTFFTNSALLEAIAETKQNDQALHIMGLLSPGGIHAHENHWFALLECLHQQEIKNSNTHACMKEGHDSDIGNKVYLHLFLDGRDSPPKAALASLEKLENILKQYPVASIKSISGRFYAMDRDSRWDRISQVDNLLTTGAAQYQAQTAQEGLELAYARGETDEFVVPTLIGTPAALQDNDTALFMNYRADRARQLARVLINSDFNAYQRAATPKLNKLLTLTHYADDIASTVLFPNVKPKHTLGECIADAGLTQLRIAETEKYAHVTFFFNGGLETPFSKEERILVASPKVATYDLAPEMSAHEITDKIIDAITNQRYDVIIANFANADMVGHTGNMDATIKAVECLDTCLALINKAAKKTGTDLLITADHGNADCMYDEDIHQAHTAHTDSFVPCLYIHHNPNKNLTLTHQEGSLIDIAPTILKALNLPQPSDMEGKSLIK